MSTVYLGGVDEYVDTVTESAAELVDLTCVGDVQRDELDLRNVCQLGEAGGLFPRLIVADPDQAGSGGGDDGGGGGSWRAASTPAAEVGVLGALLPMASAAAAAGGGGGCSSGGWGSSAAIRAMSA